MNNRSGSALGDALSSFFLQVFATIFFGTMLPIIGKYRFPISSSIPVYIYTSTFLIIQLPLVTMHILSGLRRVKKCEDDPETDSDEMCKLSNNLDSYPALIILLSIAPILNIIFLLINININITNKEIKNNIFWLQVGSISILSMFGIIGLTSG